MGKRELSSLNECRKADLLAVAVNYGITVAPSLKKAELKAAVIRELCVLGIFGTSAVDAVQDTNKAMAAGSSPSRVSPVTGPSAHGDAEMVGGVSSDATPQVHAGGGERKPGFTLPCFEPLSAESSASSKLDVRLKWRLAHLKMEGKERREEEKREEERRGEREFQLRRELELKRLELESEAQQLRHREVQRAINIAPSGGLDGRASSLTFARSRHISLVPAFCETEVEAYFGAFERIAAALNWPVNVWAILLQCKLFGKAQEASSALSVEDGLHYDKVKTAILRAYELVPEAYRQCFRCLRKLLSLVIYRLRQREGDSF